MATDEIVSKADACTSALTEAGRLVAEREHGARVHELLDQAGLLLDELDEQLLLLAHDEDWAVFAQLQLLRETLNGLRDRSTRIA